MVGTCLLALLLVPAGLLWYVTSIRFVSVCLCIRICLCVFSSSCVTVRQGTNYNYKYGNAVVFNPSRDNNCQVYAPQSRYGSPYDYMTNNKLPAATSLSIVHSALYRQYSQTNGSILVSYVTLPNIKFSAATPVSALGLQSFIVPLCVPLRCRRTACAVFSPTSPLFTHTHPQHAPFQVRVHFVAGVCRRHIDGKRKAAVPVHEAVRVAPRAVLDRQLYFLFRVRLHHGADFVRPGVFVQRRNV